MEIKQLDSKCSGTVMIGVTGLPPSQACVAYKASGLQGQSFILCAYNGTTCLFVGGEVSQGKGGEKEREEVGRQKGEGRKGREGREGEGEGR